MTDLKCLVILYNPFNQLVPYFANIMKSLNTRLEKYRPKRCAERTKERNAVKLVLQCRAVCCWDSVHLEIDECALISDACNYEDGFILLPDKRKSTVQPIEY